MINQNPTQIPELTPTSSRISKILRVLKNPPVQTTIGASILVLSAGSGYVGCLKNNTEMNACIGEQTPLAIVLGAVGAVFSAVIFKCIREFNQHY